MIAQDTGRQRQTIIDGLIMLYGECPEDYLDPIRGIIGMVPDNQLDSLTNELSKAVMLDANRHQEASNPRRRR